MHAFLILSLPDNMDPEPAAICEGDSKNSLEHMEKLETQQNTAGAVHHSSNTATDFSFDDEPHAAVCDDRDRLHRNDDISRVPEHAGSSPSSPDHSPVMSPELSRVQDQARIDQHPSLDEREGLTEVSPSPQQDLSAVSSPAEPVEEMAGEPTAHTTEGDSGFGVSPNDSLLQEHTRNVPTSPDRAVERSEMENDPQPKEPPHRHPRHPRPTSPFVILEGKKHKVFNTSSFESTGLLYAHEFEGNNDEVKVESATDVLCEAEDKKEEEEEEEEEEKEEEEKEEDKEAKPYDTTGELVWCVAARHSPEYSNNPALCIQCPLLQILQVSYRMHQTDSE